MNNREVDVEGTLLILLIRVIYGNFDALVPSLPDLHRDVSVAEVSRVVCFVEHADASQYFSVIHRATRVKHESHVRVLARKRAGSTDTLLLTKRLPQHVQP